MKKMLMGALALGFGLAIVPAQAQDVDTSQIHVKKAIAEKMSAEQLQAYKVRLAQRKAAGMFDRAKGPGVSVAPGDICTAATPEIGTLPYGPINDTTVGATDNFDLPADTTNPTCVITGCTGAGPAGSLPGGAIYTGSGTGPDRGWSIQTSANCTLGITMDPAAQDLGVYVFQTQCSSSLSDCMCAADTGFAGTAETVSLNAVAGTQYFVLVDGYSTGATPPGPSDAYTLAITGAGCTLVPVELQGFSVE